MTLFWCRLYRSIEWHHIGVNVQFVAATWLQNLHRTFAKNYNLLNWYGKVLLYGCWSIFLFFRYHIPFFYSRAFFSLQYLHVSQSSRLKGSVQLLRLLSKLGTCWEACSTSFKKAKRKVLSPKVLFYNNILLQVKKSIIALFGGGEEGREVGILLHFWLASTIFEMHTLVLTWSDFMQLGIFSILAVIKITFFH